VGRSHEVSEASNGMKWEDDALDAPKREDQERRERAFQLYLEGVKKQRRKRAKARHNRQAFRRRGEAK
jgi:hypothetical protein